MSNIAIRVENLSKQYPFDKFILSEAEGLRAGCIGGPQARYKTIHGRENI
ncbi:MAG: hypothetical protein ABIK79_05430 [Chloroflexota bacterium]|nr:hypothetical protein [Anaerolineae bacterium]